MNEYKIKNIQIELIESLIELKRLKKSINDINSQSDLLLNKLNLIVNILHKDTLSPTKQLPY